MTLTTKAINTHCYRKPALLSQHRVRHEALREDLAYSSARRNKEGPAEEVPRLCIHRVRELRPDEDRAQAVPPLQLRRWQVPAKADQCRADVSLPITCPDYEDLFD